MTLGQAVKGQRLRIVSLPEGQVRAQAIRLGLSEGAVITCKEVIPGGPVVVGLRHQEIAIGRRLALGFKVVEAAATGPVGRERLVV